MLIAEGCVLASRSKAAAVRDCDAEVLVGIDGGVIDADFVVKMGAGRASAFSYITNHVAAMHRLSGSHRVAGKMAITGADAVAVIDHDLLAVSAHDLA